MLGRNIVSLASETDPVRAESALWMFIVVAGLLVAFLLAVALLTIARRTRLFDRKKPARPPHADIWREAARRRIEQETVNQDDLEPGKDEFGPWPDKDHNGNHDGDDDDLQR